jgi:hypothetical protein
MQCTLKQAQVLLQACARVPKQGFHRPFSKRVMAHNRRLLLLLYSCNTL